MKITVAGMFFPQCFEVHSIVFSIRISALFHHLGRSFVFRKTIRKATVKTRKQIIGYGFHRFRTIALVLIFFSYYKSETDTEFSRKFGKLRFVFSDVNISYKLLLMCDKEAIEM